MSHIAVILAPVVDPLVPAKQLRLGDDGDIAAAKVKHVLGPYDEAALETALALRDKTPGGRLTALVFGGAAANETLRHVMALKANTSQWLALDAATRWDAGATARGVVDAVRALETRPDIILMGPELGDHDDGLVPPLVAELLGLPFFSSAYQVALQGDDLTLVRQVGDHEERLTTRDPVLATVLTHPTVRLRLPLLKNIMAAGRQPMTNETVQAPLPAAVRLQEVELASVARKRGAECRMLEGGADEKAAALASLIREKMKA